MAAGSVARVACGHPDDSGARLCRTLAHPLAGDKGVVRLGDVDRVVGVVVFFLWGIDAGVGAGPAVEGVGAVAAVEVVVAGLAEKIVVAVGPEEVVVARTALD